MEEIDFGHNPN